MIEGLIGSPLPCSPAQRFTFEHAPSESVTRLSKKPGTWYRLEPGGSPFIVCPRCGESGRLGNHVIAADGRVDPSVVCVMQSCGDGVKRCDAHYYATLGSYARLS